MISSTAVVFVGQLFWASQPATPTGQPPQPDREVMIALLDDMATYRGKDSPIDGIFSPNPLTLHPTPLRYPINAENVLRQYHPAPWGVLPAAAVSALKEAAADLARRATEDGTVFVAGSKHVPLYAGPDAKAEPFHKMPMEAWLPGFSMDRRLAIIALSKAAQALELRQ